MARSDNKEDGHTLRQSVLRFFRRQRQLGQHPKEVERVFRRLGQRREVASLLCDQADSWRHEVVRSRRLLSGDVALQQEMARSAVSSVTFTPSLQDAL